MSWIGANTNIFSGGQGSAVAWNGSMWVAVGSGNGNTIAYSYDGIVWTAANTNFFSGGIGYGVAWNGSMWVAVGSGIISSIAYSYNGINWTAATDFFDSLGYGVAWNGSMWVAVGYGTSSTSNTIAYSYNGIDWSAAANFFSGQYARGLAYNSARPNTFTFTPSGGITPGVTGGIVTTPITLSAGNVLDVVSDTYYNQGFSEFSVSMTTN